MAISDQELQNALLAVLIGEADATESLLGIGDNPNADESDDGCGGSPALLDSVASFAEAGVLTYNKGLVLRLSNGARSSSPSSAPDDAVPRERGTSGATPPTIDEQRAGRLCRWCSFTNTQLAARSP